MTPADDGVARTTGEVPSLSSVLVSRLEKAAVDNGFDRQFPSEGGWLTFGSTQCPLRLWFGTNSAEEFAVAFSQRNVGAALASFGRPHVRPGPSGAASVMVVNDIPTLHRLTRRAFQLAKSLPDELLHRFEQATGTMPRSTDVERLVVQRVGQDIFRAGLMEYWDSRCALTGLAIPELLRASHIKPWADCETDAERLDVYNGLLLAPHLDALFDQGFITVDEAGAVVVSGALDSGALPILGIQAVTLRAKITLHENYLRWHRQHVFRHGF